jgi:HK97 family phage portal protein
VSVLHRRGERRTASLDGLNQVLRMSGIQPRGQGGYTHVSEQQALQLSAVWACVRLIADKVSGLPVDVYRKVGDRRLEVSPQPPIVSEPSALVSRQTWVYQQLVSMLFRGNGYGIVTQVGVDGWPLKVEIVHPDCIEGHQADQLSPATWQFERRAVDAASIYHVSAYNVPGSVFGLAPITYAARSLGLGLAVDDYGTEVLTGGGHPTAILSTDQRVDDTTARTVKDRFKTATRDDHLAVLGAGLKYDRVQISPAEAQFLETRNATVIDICRYFGCPPESVYAAMSGSSITYANREQRALDLLADSLQWWMTRIEEKWSSLLPRGQYVKFNEQALLRVDLLTKMRAEDIQIRLGIKSRDEIRALNDDPPIPDGTGGEFLWPPYNTVPDPQGGPNA